MHRHRRLHLPGPRPGSEEERDRGSGTVLLVGVVAVVAVLLVAVGLLVAAERARVTAQSAADLAALAAASRLGDPAGTGGTRAACTLAAEVARRNGARLVGCTAQAAGVVTVATAREAATGQARATARAGPASVRDPP